MSPEGSCLMNGMSAAATSEPILRTLAPSLRALAERLTKILESQRQFPLDVIQRAGLEGIVADLLRKAQDLSESEPLLIVMLMGGTGVGKSTLLNAFAGAEIASASPIRPTTRDPVVYLHEAIPIERLDPALRACRLQRHSRATLRQKVVVDTPDLDSTELANRDRLMAVMPVADIVLYVGSQEKYHDRLGWEIFRDQRQRRAFAFVLNKWDRCLHPGATGFRPDEDLLRDLQREGFLKPLLFRTSASRWLNRVDGQPPSDLPEGEQFAELVHWLELGLSHLEIEAVKARGVLQLLDDLDQQLARAMPPDLTMPAKHTASAWAEILREEAEDDAQVLVNALDPSQPEIERHFIRQGHEQFKGPTLWYLKLYHGVQDMGLSLTSWIPSISKSTNQRPTADQWDLARVTRDCIRIGRERSLDQRLLALGNRLLIEAQNQGFPLNVLNDSVAEVGKLDWPRRLEEAVREAFQRAEQVWVRPTGTRRWIQKLLVVLGNFLPMAVFFGGYLLVMYRFYIERTPPTMVDLFAPIFFFLLSLVLLQILIGTLLPIRWPTIRAEFRRQLRDHLEQVLRQVYLPIPPRLAETIQQERRQLEEVRAEAKKVRDWLQGREQATRVAALYGSEPDR